MPLLLGAAFVGPQPPPSDAAEAVEILFFWGEGCPHCETQKTYLAEWERRYPQIEVRSYEVWRDPDNRRFFEEVAAAHGIDARAVPTTFIDGRVWIGFDRSFAADMEAVITELVADLEPEPTPSPNRTISVPLVGEVDLAAHSLVAMTGLIAFVDGFNPCSLWVLTVLLGMILRSGSRRGVALVGITFLTVTALIYGLFIAGLFSVFTYVAYLGWVRAAVASFALLFAIVNIKDYFAFKRGVSFTIPERAKPGIYRRVRGVMSSRSTPTMLAGTVVMAAGIAFVELPCTAGFPMVWSATVADQMIPAGAFVSLLLLYLLVYLAIELVIFGSALVTMRTLKMQERHGRVLKLFGGMIMLTLAVVLVAAPQVMETVSGAFGVFAGAILASIVVFTGHRLLTQMSRVGRS